MVIAWRESSLIFRSRGLNFQNYMFLGVWVFEILLGFEVWVCEFFIYRGFYIYNLLQNGHHFSVLLFTWKLALVASFLTRNSKEYFPLNEATRAGAQVNKRMLKWRPFLNKMYDTSFWRLGFHLSQVLVDWVGGWVRSVLCEKPKGRHSQWD